MKGDFFSRLAERTLGVAAVAKPDLLPVFVATPESAGINEAIPIFEETVRRSEHNRSPVSGTSESMDPGARAPQSAVQNWKPRDEKLAGDDEVIDRERDTPKHEPRAVDFRDNRYTADVVRPESQHVSAEFSRRQKIVLADRIAATAATASSTLARTLVSPPPAIHISIGRVEVRAVSAPTAVPKEIERKAPSRLSLDQYLRERNEGRR